MCVCNHCLLLTQERLCNPNLTLPRCVPGGVGKSWLGGKRTQFDLILLWTELMRYHRTELSWACFVSLCPVFCIFGLLSRFVPLELPSLLRQSCFSLLGLLGCSLCSLIPTLLLNFSASWDLAFSHLPKQSQRLCQDNCSFYQLFIKLVAFPCHSQFFKAPILAVTDFYPYCVWN